jgi:ribosomal 50S subunit-associated protein YjgA (DUF615 family)
MASERERLAAALQQSLTSFAQLRELLRQDGPEAVAQALESLPDTEVRQILLALVVTTGRAEDDTTS